jgi:hypothetical protein
MNIVGYSQMIDSHSSITNRRPAMLGGCPMSDTRRKIPDVRYEMANAPSPRRFGSTGCHQLCQTKPIIHVSGLQMAIVQKDKANLGGRSGRDLRSRISNPRSAIQGSQAGDWRQTKPISSFSGPKTGVERESKANQSQFGPGMVAHGARVVCAGPECRGRGNNR